jgi:hypothetical protein
LSLVRRSSAALLALTALSCGDSTAPTVAPPARAIILAGNDQVAIVGQTVAVAPTVLVTDANSQPLPGITVVFAVTGGGGSVTPTSVTTNSSGEARATWTLGNSFVQNTLTATVFGLPSVTFNARAVAPDTPILAFSHSDPAGDTLGTGTFSARAHDVLSLHGDFKRDSLIVTLTFVAPVAPASLLAPNSVGGFVELDADDNVATGDPPFSNVFGASANLGIDYVIDLFATTSTTAEVVATATEQTAIVPASFSGSSVVLRVPMSALGSDDGNFGVVGVIGTFDRATDVFPNSGQTTARRSLGAVEGRLEHVSPRSAFPVMAAAPSHVQEIWRTRSGSGIARRSGQRFK